MFCLNDFFFDIVFDLMINNDTYDFTDYLLCQGEYKDGFCLRDLKAGRVV